MQKIFVDRKSRLTVGFFYLLNKVVSRWHFKRLNIEGNENIPSHGSFMLIANHTSRWDGPVLMETIRRASNWMVSPNELKGLQGLILRSVGAFPANSRFDLIDFVAQQITKGEPVVIFPEGNIFRDGQTHPFKSGAARIILTAKALGIDIPVVSAVIRYVDQASVKVVVSKPVYVNSQFSDCQINHHEKVRRLTDDLQEKLSVERLCLERDTGLAPVDCFLDWRPIIREDSIQLPSLNLNQHAS